MFCLLPGKWALWVWPHLWLTSQDADTFTFTESVGAVGGMGCGWDNLWILGSSCQTISDAQTHGGSGLLASVSRGKETGGEVDKGRRWLSKADASSPRLGGRCRNAMAETRGWRHRAALARAWRGMEHTWAGRCDEETSADHSDAKKTRYSLESHFIRNHANLNI